jgi:two-component system, NtrC family, nitrogen regulation sensor histidine kinase NtrY
MMSIHPGQSRVIKIPQGTGMQMFSLKVAVLIFGTNRYRLFSLSDIKNEIEENELDSWQKLISVMTHEIMNSVAPITSLSNTLTRIFIRNKQPLPVSDITDTHIANVIHGLEVIENTGQGLMRFVADYRKLTKIPIPAFKPIPVADWLNAIRMLMECRLTEESIRFNMDYKGSKQEFIGDEKLLTQVMINIINNAADALSETTDKRISLHTSENSQGKLIIKIADNGKGIPAEELDKIFIPFYTTKENGSGIGLSLSRKIIRLHRGSMSVVSKPGEQTIFTLII